MTNPLVKLPVLAEVRQHNALINSPFTLSTLEWRAFTALLQRISPDDEELKEHFIPVAELVDVGTGGGKAYAQIAELSDQITERKLRVEQLGPKGERLKKPDYRIIPLLALASYVEKRGGLVLVLNPLFTPYLLQLAEKGNFTKSLAAELKHLKGGYAFKLYWLLSEYRTFGTRTFLVDELRFRLGMSEDEYKGRFDNFKVKVLDKAQTELARTDLAFEMEILRKGRKVEQIRFTFSAKPLLLAENAGGELPVAALAIASPPSSPEAEPWAQLLRAQGISEEGCELIRRHLAEGQYPTTYLDYVLAVLRKPRKTPVRKPADYLFKCITGKLLLDEYHRSQLPPAAEPATSARRKAVARPAVTASSVETVLALTEVRQMYENPGPFAKRSEQAATFEEHLQRIYLSQGFVLETRGSQEILILRV
ncbi:MAG: replication initiation protein [Janthinobacterium lividum]